MASEEAAAQLSQQLPESCHLFSGPDAAVELVAGVLVFAWIILFIRNAAALQADTTP